MFRFLNGFEKMNSLKKHCKTDNSCGGENDGSHSRFVWHGISQSGATEY